VYTLVGVSCFPFGVVSPTSMDRGNYAVSLFMRVYLG